MLHYPRSPLRRLGRLLLPRRLRLTINWMLTVSGAIVRRRRDSRLGVAVDAASLYEPLTGIGWYTYQLLAHLAPREDVAARLYGPVLLDDPTAPRPHVTLPTGPALEQVLYPPPPAEALAAGPLARLLHRLSALLVWADGNRVCFAPNYLAPPHFRFARGALVATVHDLAIERLPWAVRPDSREALARRLERTFAHAHRLITPSAAVRQELIDAGHFAAERIHAIHHGTGQASQTPSAAAPSPRGATEPLPVAAVRRLTGTTRYALHVGTLEPRKNLLLLLSAWRRLREAQPDAPELVLCGGYGWSAGDLRREVELGSAEGWLIHLGYVDASKLVQLYREARLVVLPSLYEGFGLPAVEAMACGIPLVASDLPVLREVAADAALYAPPDDAEAWARQIERLLVEPGLAADMAARGRARAAAFDWHRTATETLAVWRLAAG